MNFLEPELERRKNRDDEPVAAFITLEGGFMLPIYEVQVAEANRILNPYIDAIVKKAMINDEVAEHSRLIGTNALEVYNELTVTFLDEAILIVDSPIAYDSYILDPATNKPVTVGQGVKPMNSFIRFDAVRLSAVQNEDLEIVPRAEIIECQPGSKPSVYNSIAFDPREQRIALQDIDTPSILIS